MIMDKKTSQKVKYFGNMSNSIIFGGHFENMQIKGDSNPNDKYVLSERAL